MTETVEWQPIETAPKDGTIVLTYGTAKFGGFVADALFAEGDGWCLFDPLNDSYCFGFEPSHWMPIPKPPVLV